MEPVESVESGGSVACSRCAGPLDPVVPGWCPACRRAERVGAGPLLAWLVPGAEPVAATDEWHDPDPLHWPGYDDLRARARQDTGADESVTVVRGEIAGTEAVVVAWDFGFLGGSMGTIAGRRIAGAYDAARQAALPVVLLPSTGGARMQEGMASLVQMAATSAAAAAHAEAGLLQIAALRDPSTGGVFASHANLADIVLAEPGATIGFAGPRVAEAVTHGPLPSGSHTAQGAHAAGLVDAVVARPDLPGALGPLLAWGAAARAASVATQPGSTHDTPHAPATTEATTAPDTPDAGDAPAQPGPPGDPWQEVQRARAADRPRAPAFLAHGSVEVAGHLRGDRAGGVDAAITVACATWADRPVVVLAMDPAGGAIGPAGYRTARRGMDVAARLGVPVVTLVDTPGADPSAGAEAGGIAHEIAATMHHLMTLPVPAVCLVVGEGGSGGALALATGDRLLLQEHAIFSVIAPEGAAAILHRDRERAPEVAALLDPTAHRLHELGIADEVVPEPAGAAGAAVDIGVAAVTRHLAELADPDRGALVDWGAARCARWRDPLP